MKRYARTHCQVCGQTISAEIRAEQKRRKSASHEATLARKKAAGERIGRPVSHDHAEILRLRRMGNTIKKISEILRCSPSTVDYVMRKQKEAQ